MAELVDGDGDAMLDLSAVTFIDSTALRVLVHAHTTMGSVGGRLIVTNPSPIVVRVLPLTGLVPHCARRPDGPLPGVGAVRTVPHMSPRDGDGADAIDHDDIIDALNDMYFDRGLDHRLGYGPT